MIRLYLVRHGRTSWNCQERFTGQTDIPLDRVGRAQTGRLSAHLRDVRFDLVLTSDLRRARETAGAIASRRGLTPVPDSRLREAAFGEWEGLTFGEISARYPEIARDWALNPFHCTPPGAEPLTALAARVDEMRRRVLAAGEGTNVLAVTHGGPARLLICLALGLEPEKHWRFALGPGGMAVLEFHDGEGILCRLEPKPPPRKWCLLAKPWLCGKVIR